MKIEKKDNTRRLNLAAKKTEEEWANTLHGLAEDLAQTWFKWLSWCFALGAISYLADKTGSNILMGLKVTSYIVLVFYFQQFFNSFRIEPYESWVLSQRTRFRLFLAILPAAILTTISLIATNRLIHHAVEQINFAK